MSKINELINFEQISGTLLPTREQANAPLDKNHNISQANTAHGDSSAKKESKVNFNFFSFILVLFALAICAAAGFLVSSGRLIEIGGVRKDQHSAAYDILSNIASVRLNTINSINGMPKVYTLPLSNTPANKANPDGFSSYVDDKGVTHSTYIDDTITVDCSRTRYKIGKSSVIAAVARVKISHPTQFRSGFASGKFGTRRKTLTSISRQYNAIVAINGEMYNHPGRNNLLIRQGTVYRSTINYKRSLFVDTDGNFIIKSSKAAKSEGLLDGETTKIMHSFTFGPPLVIDGEVQKHDGRKLYTYRNPRTAIGQIGPLEYLMVVVEGRTKDSHGMTIDELAKFMLEQGCTQAYNLDGGQSSELVFHHKLHSVTCYGNERSTGDMLYFGTAMPEQ